MQNMQIIYLNIYQLLTLRHIILDPFISKLIFSIWLINLVYHKPTFEGRVISNYVISDIKLVSKVIFNA